jgi:hypothetical protein
VVLQTERLALLWRPETAHPGAVLGAFLRRHQLAAINLILLLYLRLPPGLFLVGRRSVTCRQGKRSSQRRQNECVFEHADLLIFDWMGVARCTPASATATP